MSLGIAKPRPKSILDAMVTFSEIQAMAFDLTKSEQLRLADQLLSHAADDDAMEPEDILAEVIRRDEEMTNGTDPSLTVDEFWASVRRPGQPE